MDKHHQRTWPLLTNEPFQEQYVQCVNIKYAFVQHESTTKIITKIH
jgi:hypothetical protein